MRATKLGLLVLILVFTFVGTAAAQSWTAVSTVPGDGNVTDIAFSDLSNGWVAKGGAYDVTTLLRTRDAGATWETLLTHTPSIASLESHTPEEVFVGGSAGSFKHTGNGGLTWDIAEARMYSWPWSPEVTEIHFDDAQHGWLYATWWESGLIDEYLFTSDGGKTWANYYCSLTFNTWTEPEQDRNVPPSAIVNGSHGSDVEAWFGDQGWAARDEWSSPIGHTCDGGLTWRYEPGFYVVDFDAVDANTAYAGGGDTLYLTQNGGSDLHVAALGGADRYATNVYQSRHAFPSTVTTLVVGTGQDWPDALGASALAGAVDGPLLLVQKDSVPAVVRTEIQRLKPKDIIIVGGEPVVSAGVMSSLKGLVTGSVSRIAGKSRFETAAQIATSDAIDDGFDGTVYIGTGAAYADALAIAPIAAGLSRPVLLTQRDALPAFTEAALAELAPEQVYILGGTGAVSSAVEAKLRTTCAGANVSRLSGANRYGTAAVIAQHGVAAGLNWDHLAFANGVGFADALGGGVMQGQLGSVLLLTPPSTLDAGVARIVSDHGAAVSHVSFLGGTGAMSESVRAAVRSYLN